jgi:hypothetical protein
MSFGCVWSMLIWLHDMIIFLYLLCVTYIYFVIFYDVTLLDQDKKNVIIVYKEVLQKLIRNE